MIDWLIDWLQAQVDALRAENADVEGQIKEMEGQLELLKGEQYTFNQSISQLIIDGQLTFKQDRRNSFTKG